MDVAAIFNGYLCCGPVAPGENRFGNRALARRAVLPAATPFGRAARPFYVVDYFTKRPANRMLAGVSVEAKSSWMATEQSLAGTMEGARWFVTPPPLPPRAPESIMPPVRPACCKTPPP